MKGDAARRKRQVACDRDEGPGPVSLWMTRDPVRVSVNCPIARAARLMAAHRIRHVLVVDGDRLAGIVSNRDVRGLLVDGASERALSADSPVSATMTESVVTAAPSTPLAEAVRALLDRKIGALPIVEDGRLVGILTRSDALEAFLVWAERARPAGTARSDRR
jgi:CBS domain-containing protein